MEFDRFKVDIETEVSLSAMIAVKDVQIDTQNEELNKQLKTYKKKDGAIRKQRVNTPSILSRDIAEKITTFVEKRGLYEVGHFRLYDNICARDWLRADEVIETNPMFKKCEAQFLLHLAERLKKEDNCLIVGIDFCGMLIASKLACALQKPYTYVIPKPKVNNSSVREMEFQPSVYDKIIVVTDVIVTFKTIRNIIEEYGIGDKVSAIYAVFFRKSEKREYIDNNQDLIDKMSVVK